MLFRKRLLGIRVWMMKTLTLSLLAFTAICASAYTEYHTGSYSLLDVPLAYQYHMEARHVQMVDSCASVHMELCGGWYKQAVVVCENALMGQDVVGNCNG